MSGFFQKYAQNHAEKSAARASAPGAIPSVGYIDPVLNQRSIRRRKWRELTSRSLPFRSFEEKVRLGKAMM